MCWIIKISKKALFFASFIFSLFSIFALDIDLFRLKQKNAFTNETLVFSTIIEDVPPNQIDLTVQSLPQDVSFVGSKKEKIYFNGLESTAIELHFVFSKSGTYSLSSVPIRIRYGYQYVGFETIEVTENPKNLEPKLVYSVRVKDALSGDRGLSETAKKAEFGTQSGDRGLFEQGQRLEILIAAQYFASIQSLSWQASENSIVFNETFLHSLPFYETEFHPHPIELIRFDFIALEEGEVFLPKLIVQGKNWAGLDVLVSSSSESLRFNKKSAQKQNPLGTEDSSGGRGTEDLQSSLGTEDSTGARGTEDLEDSPIHSFSPLSSGQFGFTTEEKEALVSSLEKSIVLKKQMLRLFSYFSLGLCIFLVILRLLLIRRNKKGHFLLPLAIIIFICYFFISGYAKQKWLVFEGTLYAIPEQNANLLQVVDRPIVVHVLLETNEWARVAYPILKSKHEVHYAWVKKRELRE